MRIPWIHWFRNQCLSLLEKSTVKQTGQQTMDTHVPLGISICRCLSVACCRKSYISHRTYVSAQLNGLQCLFFLFFISHVMHSGDLFKSWAHKLFWDKKSIRIDVDWCCSIVCFVGLLAKNQWLVAALGLLLLSLQFPHLKSLRAGNLSFIFHFLDSSLSDVLLCGQITVPSVFATFHQKFTNLTPAFKWLPQAWDSTNPSEKAIQ